MIKRPLLAPLSPPRCARSSLWRMDERSGQQWARSCPLAKISKAASGVTFSAMKTQYYTATSLDGFIATEDDSLDWLFPLGDINDTSYPSFFSEVGALAMGSSTYLWMVRHADKVAEEAGSPWPYKQPTWVFSHRKLPQIQGAEIRFVQGDVQRVHAEMVNAAAGKNIWIVGGGDLAAQFFDAGLLDEVIIQIGSVTLGSGKPLFPRRVTNPAWKLLSVRQVGTGFAELRYELPRGPAAGAA